MFNSIYGKISAKTETSLFLLNNGIEWELSISGRTSRLLPQQGEDARAYTYLYHREDAMKLFGFADETERRVFLDLLKVSGIGPRQALKILSGMPVEDFISHLEAGDADSLSHIQGLGKKTAQKIILTLKGKLKVQEEESGDLYRDVVQALVDMGYERKECAAAVQKILREGDLQDRNDGEREKEIFRRAIVMLSS